MSLGGASDAYPPLDDEKLLNNVRVLTAHDALVFAQEVVPGAHNLLIGRNVSAGARTSGNTVVGENVTIAPGVQNAVSFGRSNTTIAESDAFSVGDFLKYRSTGEELNLGPDGDVRVTPSSTSIATPLQVRSRNIGGQQWEIAIEPSEDDHVSRDLVLRAADGTAVVFCAGSAQAIP